MPVTNQTGANGSATRSSFDSLFAEVIDVGGGIAVDILRERGREYLANESASEQVGVQSLYTQLAAQSPNLGPNDVAPAQQQAVAQTGLMQGLIPGDRGGMMTLLLGGILVAVLLSVFWKRK